MIKIRQPRSKIEQLSMSIKNEKVIPESLTRLMTQSLKDLINLVLH